VKTVRIWIFLGLMCSGLIYGPASLSAQPASGPASTNGQPVPATGATAPYDDDDPNKPWNKGVSIESRGEARELFREGNRLFKIPLFMKAAEKYAAALTKWKHPGIYLNLAIAQLNSGQEAEAYANLERAIEHDAEPLGEAQFQEAKEQIKEVKRRLGRIRVTCRTQGAQVTLNGVHLFTGPGKYEGWIKAKDHEITAKKPEYLSEARRVTIVPGQTVDIDLKLVTLDEASDASRRWAVWKPWAVVAAGGAILAAGGAFHALSARNFGTYDDEFLKLKCVWNPDSMFPGCESTQIPSHLMKQLNLARQERTIAIGSYVVGSSLIAAGIMLLYLNRPRLAEQSAEGVANKGAIVVPAMSDDMLGVLMSVDY
jgi:tetratricopeptide (TPR) repeat protein